MKSANCKFQIAKSKRKIDTETRVCYLAFTLCNFHFAFCILQCAEGDIGFRLYKVSTKDEGRSNYTAK